MSLRSNKICVDAGASMKAMPFAQKNMARLRVPTQGLPGRPLRFDSTRSVKGGPARKGTSSGVRPLHPDKTIEATRAMKALRVIHESEYVQRDWMDVDRCQPHQRPDVRYQFVSVTEKCEQTGRANPYKLARRLRSSLGCQLSGAAHRGRSPEICVSFS